MGGGSGISGSGPMKADRIVLKSTTQDVSLAMVLKNSAKK